MFAFFAALLLFLTLFLALGTPVLLMAWRRGRDATVRRFLASAGGLALVCALISASSKRLTDQCAAAGNTGCLDFGATGFQFLIVVVYGLVALIYAYNLHGS